jgi:hypothetical protein
MQGSALGGKHKFLVEHIGLGNFACLSLKLKKLADGKMMGILLKSGKTSCRRFGPKYLFINFLL